MDKTRIEEGFPGQIIHKIPKPVIPAEHPLVQSLFITDLGWYPRARHHYRKRERGAEENILIVCTKGCGWYEIEGQRKRLEAGHALLIPRGTPHSYESDDTHPWSIAWMHFRGNDAPYYTQLLPDHQFAIPVSKRCLPIVKAGFRSGYAAVQESYNPTSIVFLAHLCRHLLGVLFFRNSSYSARLRAPASHDLKDTIAYIIEHCRAPLSRDQLAQRAGLSIPHFSLLFKRQTGVSPVQFLIQQKIKEACRLIDTSSLTFREIALQIGYEDPYYFSRLFRKTTGHSPREYRALRKG